MIKNALIRAAYLACDVHSPITQKLLEDSCLDEYQANGKVARDPSAIPAPKLRIPEDAIELPQDWQERGISPDMLVQSRAAARRGNGASAVEKDEIDVDERADRAAYEAELELDKRERRERSERREPGDRGADDV